MIPKFHGAKLTDIPDEELAELLVCFFPLLSSLLLWKSLQFKPSGPEGTEALSVKGR